MTSWITPTSPGQGRARAPALRGPAARPPGWSARLWSARHRGPRIRRPSAPGPGDGADPAAARRLGSHRHRPPGPPGRRPPGCRGGVVAVAVAGTVLAMAPFLGWHRFVIMDQGTPARGTGRSGSRHRGGRLHRRPGLAGRQPARRGGRHRPRGRRCPVGAAARSSSRRRRRIVPLVVAGPGSAGLPGPPCRTCTSPRGRRRSGATRRPSGACSGWRPSPGAGPSWRSRPPLCFVVLGAVVAVLVHGPGGPGRWRGAVSPAAAAARRVRLRSLAVRVLEEPVRVAHVVDRVVAEVVRVGVDVALRLARLAGVAELPAPFRISAGAI